MLVRFGERLLFAYFVGDDRVRLMRGTDIVRELTLDEAARLVVAIAPSLADRTAALDAGLRVEAGGAMVRIARAVPVARAVAPARRAA